MEDQDKPRRDLKGLCLLPILALGLSVLFVARKKSLPSHQPTKVAITLMAKGQAYEDARYRVMSQITRYFPKSDSGVRIAPYTEPVVIDLGQGHFRCSGSFQARSTARVTLREQWQCIMTQHHGYWSCEAFQQTPWKPVSLDPVKGAAASDGLSHR